MDRGTLRTKAEENFRAEYGHHPIRVELPESPSDHRRVLAVLRFLDLGSGTDDKETS